jgi:ATP-dependent helicase/nuclease subunit B
VVARLPRGALILPGLDGAADDETWKALKPTHPQYGMAQLLARLGLDRRDVRPWPAAGVGGTPPARAALINRALRPAAAGGGGRGPAPAAEGALASVTRIDAPGPEEEARAIALIMRGALEHPGKTAALVTPDRPLARRVARELERWSLEVDDSAGRPLAETPPGAFLRLTARMVAENCAPVPLLAVVKHPLAAGGLFPAQFRARVRRLERAVLRGPRPAPGIAGLASAVGAAGGEADLIDIVAGLNDAVEPFGLLFAGAATLRDLLRAHVAMAERLAASPAETGAERLWAGEAGEAAAGFVAELNEAADGVDPLAADAYPALLDVLLAGRVVRPRYGRHPRLAILGPLEARLRQTDVMILGSLNEDTWPPKAHVSPWMSRGMMQEFGLPLPERRIGLSAHDFAQAFSAPEVWLTRSSRVAGSPTVPCRWLLRLENVLRMADGSGALGDARPWLRWQGGLDAPERVRAVDPPEPRPPVAARPRRLSVTQVETWMRDPYAVYARHVLRLRALEPIDADPTTADYGARIHKALDLFVAAHPGPLPGNAVDALLEAGRAAFGALLEQPAIRAFWWPRFERIARWFVAAERERRPEIAASATEVGGTLTLDVAGGPFEITAIADRIDILADGSLAIIDYKTGAPPREREVAAGFAPQLPLEAAIAASGGFAGVPAHPVSCLSYWRLHGGEPAGQRIALKADPLTLARDAVDGLRALATEFDIEATPYRSRPSPAAAPKFSDYEHLARVKEWSAGGDEDE